MQRDCGIGPDGFGPGNKCASGGEVIGKGSSGDVVAKDGKVYKNAFINGKKTKESEVYSKIAGSEGVSQGELNGDKIVTPQYKNIVSVDAIPEKQRQSIGPIVSKNKNDIYAAVNSLSSEGYDYNDVLQFGLDDQKKTKLFDFSAAEKSQSVDDAIRNNASHLQSFFNQFGNKEESSRLGKVTDAFLGVRGLIDDDGSFDFLDDETSAIVKHLHSGLSDGKKPRFAYYATNARHVGIPGISQTDSAKHGPLKIIVSDNPISKQDVSKWELTQVYSVKPESEVANAL